MIATALWIFTVSFAFIFLKAWQQLNVIHHQIWWIIPTSFALAVCEVFLIVQAAEYGVSWIVFPLGLGAGIGCLSSMMLHRWMRDRSKK